MKHRIVLAVACAAVGQLFATDGVWTGAGEDGCWTNAANWVNGVIPGQCYDESGVLVGRQGDTATFGAVEAGAQTTIDLDGLYSICFVTVTGATAPVYTFGTSSAQILPMQGGGAGTANQANDGYSRFLVAAGVVNMPVFRAGFGVDVDVPLANFSNYGANVTLQNDGAGTLYLNNFGYPKVLDSACKGKNHRINFAGTGDIQINGVWKIRNNDNTGNYQVILEQTTGRLILNSNLKTAPQDGWCVWLFSSSKHNTYHRTLYINEGCGLYIANSSNALNYNSNTTIDGPGELRFCGVDSNTSWRGAILSGGYNLYLKCHVTSTGKYGAFGVNGSGPTHLLGNMDFSGMLTSVGQNGAIITPSIGRKGEASQFGSGTALRIGWKNGGIRYTGAGETTDRDIILCERYKGVSTASSPDKTANGFIEQSGTGEWFVDSTLVVEPTGETHVFSLKGDVAPAGYFRTALADGEDALALRKLGAGTWVLTAANTFTGGTTIEGGTLKLAKGATLASPVEFKGSGVTLEVEADGATQVSSPLKVTSGSATLKVTGTGTYEVAGLTQSAGTLNVVCDTRSVRLKVAGQGAGAAGTWLTVNGEAADFNANGEIVKRTIAIDTEIAARGDTVPNDATKNVGIVSSGSGGADTLAAAETAVKALVQKSTTDAVVAIGAGERLSAETLHIDEDAAALTVGAVPGQGTFVASGSEFAIENESEADLTVGAAWNFNAGTIRKDGVGLFRSLAPFDFTGSLILRGGLFAVADGTGLSASLAGTGTFVKESGNDWCFTKNQNDFSGDFVITGGYNTLSFNYNETAAKFGNFDGALVITNGATLDLSSGREAHPENLATDIQFGKKEVRISGTGAHGDGVIRFGYYNGVDGTLNGRADSYGRCFQRLTLDDDALIGISNCYSGVGIAGSALDPAILNMNGHTLSTYGFGKLVFENMFVTNAGAIRVDCPPYKLGYGTRAAIDLGANADLGDADSPALTMGRTSTIYMKKFMPQRRPLVIDDADVIMTTVSSATAENSDPNLNHWAGPVTVNANPETGAPYSLQVSMSTNLGTTGNPDNQMVTISGPIGGPGGITFMGCGTLNLLNPANTFAGGLNMGGAERSRVFAAWPGSLPDYSSVTVQNGRLTVDGLNWTSEKYAELLRSGTFKSSAIVTLTAAIDPSHGEDATVSFEPGALVGPTEWIGCDGKGTLVVTGATESEANLVVYDGILKVSGDEPMRFGSTKVAGDPARGEEATLLVENAKDVVFAGNMDAGKCDSTSKLKGKIVIRNARVTMPLPLPTGKEAITSSITLGESRGDATMIVEAGGVVTNKINMGTSGDAHGALIVRGGDVCNWTDQSAVINWGSAACAYLGIESGRYSQGGWVARLGDTYPCVVQQTGGEFVHFDPSYVAIVAAHGFGHYYMNAGSLKSPYQTFCICETTDRAGWGAHGVLTLDGPTAFASFPALSVANTSNTVGIVNLNAGTIETKYVGGFQNRGGSCSYLNFNGGTLRGSQQEALLYGAGFAGANSALTRVTVFEGGATFDTNGGDRRIYAPLCAPEGNGVTSLMIDGVYTSRYVGAPAIKITGDGYGASAHALFDADSGRVTAIKITSPGCNYTQATATLTYGNKNVEGGMFTFAPQTGGGITKIGEGMLTLYATNTYAGATVVKAGTLKAGGDWAFPSNTVVKLEGGTLDTNGKKCAFEDVECGSGSLVGDLATDSLTVDMAEVVKGNHVTVNGKVTLGEGSLLTLTNLAAFDPTDLSRRRIVLATADAWEGEFESVPTIEGPNGRLWQVKTGAQDLVLSYPLGMMMLVR